MNNISLIILASGFSRRFVSNKLLYEFHGKKLIEYAFKTFSPYNIKEKIENEFQNWILCNSNSFSVSKGSSNDISPYLENLNYEYLHSELLLLFEELGL